MAGTLNEWIEKGGKSVLLIGRPVSQSVSWPNAHQQGPDYQVILGGSWGCNANHRRPDKRKRNAGINGRRVMGSGETGLKLISWWSRWRLGITRVKRDEKRWGGKMKMAQKMREFVHSFLHRGDPAHRHHTHNLLDVCRKHACGGREGITLGIFVSSLLHQITDDEFMLLLLAPELGSKFTFHAFYTVCFERFLLLLF